MIVSFNNGSAPFKNQETTAWPDSWTETTFFYSLVMILFLYTPPMILSVAISRSWESTYDLPFLAAKMAASLQRLAISAPLNPGVRVASLLAYSSLVLDDSILIFYKCTLNICLLPYKSGKFISTSLSNLPGLINAVSSKFCLFVAAITITFLSV